jgi:hypothetical protein
MAKRGSKRRISPKDLRMTRGGAASVKGGGSKKISTEAPRKGTPPSTPTPTPTPAPTPTPG